MVNTETVALPEVGQLVRVRDRHWVVTNVVGSALPPDVLGQADAYACHLVELSSVEDDAFGDDLTVFWEVEPGVLILPKATLPRPEPDGFDDPARLAAFLDAVRWGAIASADVRALQSPFRSGISIEDYQLDPVVRALQMPRVNLLIADDVGLGKTIEAGLVVQELLLRHRAHTVFIVCPASLTLKWQTEMHDRFGLEFRVVDSDAVKQLRRDRGVGANIWTHFPRLIVSIDWLKRPRAMALLDEILPHDRSRRTRRFDLLIVDEVHQCAPPGRGAYAVDSLRTIALETIAPHFEHRLFLSATPHNGYPESFTALLAMLDPQRFQRRVEPNEEAKARVLVRRMKSELRKELPPRPDGSPRFPERQLLPLEVTYPDSERRVHALLKQYTDSRKTSVRAGTAATATDFVTLLLKKRLFSSPKAFLETLREHMKTLSRRGATRDISDRQLRAEFDRLDEDVETDDAQNEATRDALAVAARVLPPLASNEQKWLAEMLDWADREQHRPDAKAQVLLNWLDAVCRPHGEWNNERVIVFTEYRDTQVWLHDLLSRHGFTAGRVHGDSSSSETDCRQQRRRQDDNLSKVFERRETDLESDLESRVMAVQANPIRIGGNTAYITVACKSRGFVGEAMVDVTDLERVRRYRWYAKWDTKLNAYYAWTGVTFTDDGGRHTVTASMHRMVMKLSSPLKVDHLNHNTLDNRRANLRAVTHAQNMQNLKGARRGSTSGVRGVSWDGGYGKWKVGLKVNGRQMYLGRYDSLAAAEAAAIAGRQTYMTHSDECGLVRDK